MGHDRLPGGLGAGRLSGSDGAGRFVVLSREQTMVGLDGGGDAFGFICIHSFRGTRGDLRLRDTGTGFVVPGSVNRNTTADFATNVQNTETRARPNVLL